MHNRTVYRQTMRGDITENSDEYKAVAEAYAHALKKRRDDVIIILKNPVPPVIDITIP